LVRAQEEAQKKALQNAGLLLFLFSLTGLLIRTPKAFGA
jgi:hypothetical protein